jgi:hypothetical protein
VVVLAGIAQLGEHGVQALVGVVGLSAVPIDPRRHQVEDLCPEAARSPLGVLAAAHQTGAASTLMCLDTAWMSTVWLKADRPKGYKDGW